MTRTTNEKNVLREDRYERCLHGKPPQVAESSYANTLRRTGTHLRQGYGGHAAGAYLVQATECHALTLGEGRAVPPVYPRACGGTPSFTQIAFFAKKYSMTIWPSYRQVNRPPRGNKRE